MSLAVEAPRSQDRADPPPGDDFGLLRARLNRETQGAYQQFLRSLKPDHGRVWRGIAAGYAALAVILALLAIPTTPWALPLTVAAGAAAIGYAVAYLQLFIHEAAHFGLHPDRRTSDRLGDLLVAWQVGASVARYRTTHFAHHRALGTPQDTERSYFNALTGRFLFEMVIGAHAVRVFLAREREAGGERGGRAGLWPLARGVFVHAVLLAALAAAGAWAAAAAWVLGMAVFYPFFATLRQLLEHRPAGHGAEAAVTRLFADGPLAATFGAAGFSRHLLHHWEPHLSYTRLRDLETYLQGAGAAPLMDAARTTYLAALKDIWRHDRR